VRHLRHCLNRVARKDSLRILYIAGHRVDARGMDLVGYRRVSTAGQLEGFGLEAQRHNIEAWAKANGHRVVEWFEDQAVSGTVDVAHRPGLSAALDALRPPPKARGLVVANLDRIARQLHLQEAVLQVAWTCGANVYAVAQGEVVPDDPDDPYRTAIRQIMGTMAQLERGLIAKRMRDGRRAKAAAGGKATGSYAYGQRGEGAGRQRVVVVDEQERRAVDRIVELRAAGWSYRSVAQQLDEEGLRPRRAEAWSAMSVRNVAVREAELL
jgi:DNA invertase Pin-like site-specific DNA recombinase